MNISRSHIRILFFATIILGCASPGRFSKPLEQPYPEPAKEKPSTSTEPLQIGVSQQLAREDSTLAVQKRTQMVTPAATDSSASGKATTENQPSNLAVLLPPVKAKPETTLVKPPPLINPPPRITQRSITNKAFEVGEKLTFSLNYGFIRAGTAVMSVERIVNIQDNPTYLISSTARSARFFDTFYKVDDRVETYVDKDGIYSHRFFKRLREGSYKLDVKVDFLHNKGLASIKNTRLDDDDKISKATNDTVGIPPFVQDVLSSFYYIRTQVLEPGKSVFIANQDQEKVYNLQIKVYAREKVNVGAGTFNTLVVEPLLKSGGIFKSEGRLVIWLSDDERKIPVKMSSKVLVGSISAELEKYEGVVGPLTSKIK